MFCQSCGEILPDGAHFCPKCGQSCAAQVEIPDNINFSFDDELTPVDKETEVVVGNLLSQQKAAIMTYWISCGA